MMNTGKVDEITLLVAGDDSPFVQLFDGVLPEREFLFWQGRKFRFDFAWPHLWTAIEVDGGLWIAGRHSRGGEAQLAELAKFNFAAALGWRVFHFTPEQIRTGEAIEFLRAVFPRNADGTARRPESYADGKRMIKAVRALTRRM